MDLGGEQFIAADRQTVWTALNDPAVLRQCIPGCQSLEAEGENAYRATVEVKVGPIGATFRSTVRLEDLDPPARYRIVGEGKGGMAGNASGAARVSLGSEGSGTRLRYEVSAEIGGRLAQLGGAVVEATARRLAEQFFARFERIVTGAEVADEGATSPAARSAAAPRIAGPQGFPWGWALALVAVALAAFLAGGGMQPGVLTKEPRLLVMALLLVFATATGFAWGQRR